MNVIEQVSSHIQQYQPGLSIAELKAKEEAAKIKAKAKADREKEVDAYASSANSNDHQDPADSKLAIKALYPDAVVAEFDDRIEYISNDNTKLIDRGDSLSITSGRFQTSQQAAAMLIETANAKKWKQVVIDSDNKEIVDYAKGIAKGMGIEAKTAQEWKEAATQAARQETKDTLKAINAELAVEAEVKKQAENKSEDVKEIISEQLDENGFDLSEQLDSSSVASTVKPLESIKEDSADVTTENVKARSTDELEP